MSSPRPRTIIHVIHDMQTLLSRSRRTPRLRSFVPFLHAYLGVTKRVEATIRKHPRYFKRVDQMHALDVHFADLYFTPINAFIAHGKYPSPWRTYLEYCRKPGRVPFICLMLGVNAHINADLCQTLVEVEYRERKDYFAINPLLLAEAPHIMKFLAFSERDVIGLGAMVFSPLTELLFDRLIINWRLDAWNNARQIRRGTLTQARVNQATEKLAQDIIRVFEELLRLKNIQRNINALVKLRISRLP